MDKKSQALAILFLVIVIIILLAAFFPPVKETIIDIISAIRGNPAAVPVNATTH
ncbi:hypothetical protein KY347_03540 [Candidatus Woesearchaeota archaeon]|nr:hypothetical protein [Candidatus Woesearchaeota archaeon]